LTVMMIIPVRRNTVPKIPDSVFTKPWTVTITTSVRRIAVYLTAGVPTPTLHINVMTIIYVQKTVVMLQRGVFTPI